MDQAAALERTRREQAADAKAQERDRLHKETWRLVSQVGDALASEGHAPESELIPAEELARYRRAGEGVGGPFSLLWRLRQDRLAQRAVGGWDLATKITASSIVQGSEIVTEHQLFLGRDNRIYGVRGMTEREWERGVLRPDFARDPSNPLPFDHQYEEIQRGLANLTARYGLTFSP